MKTKEEKENKSSQILQPNRASDQAVQSATGRTWEEWFSLLDSLGADQKNHQEIARMIMEKELLNPGQEWWAQGVTVAYEYEKGKRIPGLSADAGYEIGVQRTIPHPAEHLWAFMFSTEGLPIWLGTLSGEFPQAKGGRFETEEGTVGELRSIVQGQKIRMTWQPSGQQTPATLQIYWIPKGTNTSLRFHMEKLQSAEEREAMRAHWKQVADDLSAALDQTKGN